MRTRARKRSFNDSLVAQGASRGSMVERSESGKKEPCGRAVWARKGTKDDEDRIGWRMLYSRSEGQRVELRIDSIGS